MGADPAFVASQSRRLGVSTKGFIRGDGERPTAREMFEASALEMLVDDVTGICQRVPFIEVAPAKLFDPSLLSELADAADRLSAKVGDLQERQGASR